MPGFKASSCGACDTGFHCRMARAAAGMPAAESAYGALENMRIEHADTPEFLDTVRALFREYEASIKVDLCFQGLEKEMGRVAHAQGFDVAGAPCSVCERGAFEVVGVCCLQSLHRID